MGVRSVFALGLFLAAAGPASAQTVVDTRAVDGPWPTSGWTVVDSIEAGADRSALVVFQGYAFPEVRDDEERTGVRSDGIVVVRDGVIIYEHYAGGYTAQTRHLAWSVTKSMVHTLYGVALQQALIAPADLHAPIPPNWQGRETWNEMTAAHMLWMASGLDFREEYEESPFDSSTIAMLYGDGARDMARYVAMREFRETDAICQDPAPGHCFTYSSGDSNIATAYLRTLIGDRVDWQNFPWDGVFEPIGMTSAVLEADQAGTFVGSSYLYATPRDLARWGYLYLRNGIWDGERLLPADWVAEAWLPNDAYLTTCQTPDGYSLRRCIDDPAYATHWWTNRISRDDPEAAFWCDIPADLFFAWGHWGQRVFIIPSLDMVIVRTADDRDDTFDNATFLELALAAFAPERGDP